MLVTVAGWLKLSALKNCSVCQNVGVVAPTIIPLNSLRRSQSSVRRVLQSKLLSMPTSTTGRKLQRCIRLTS
ncbi:unnamed protein product [Arabidopsis halleri]